MTATLETFKTEREWLDARRKAITSTDAAVIAGVGYDSPLSLWMEKTGRIESKPDSRRFRFGRKAEEFIAEELTIETGLELEALPPYSLVRREANPTRLASLDRKIVPSGLAEFKTVSSRVADKWKDGPADYAFVQVQHALYVTGYDFAMIAALIGAGEAFLTFRVEPNPDFINELLEREAAFEKLVKEDTPPLATGSEADAEALAKLYPKDQGTTILLDATAYADDIRDLREAREQLKRYETVKDEVEAKLKQAMGEASYAEIPGVARFSWKTQIKHMKAQDARTTTVRVFREGKVNER